MAKLFNHCQHIAACVLLALVLHGCGMRGDLYLPDTDADSDKKPVSTETLDAESLTGDQTTVEDRQGFSEDPAENETEFAADDVSDDDPDEGPDNGSEKTVITEDGEYDSVTPPLP